MIVLHSQVGKSKRLLVIWYPHILHFNYILTFYFLLYSHNLLNLNSDYINLLIIILLLLGDVALQMMPRSHLFSFPPPFNSFFFFLQPFMVVLVIVYNLFDRINTEKGMLHWLRKAFLLESFSCEHLFVVSHTFHLFHSHYLVFFLYIYLDLWQIVYTIC